jgi:N-acetyltransferase
MSRAQFESEERASDASSMAEFGWPTKPVDMLVGTRCTLRELNPGRDSRSLFEALDNESVWEHIPSGRPGTVAEYEERLALRSRDPNRIQFVICDALTEEVVGTTSLVLTSATAYSGEIGSTTLAPSRWGSGINRDSKFLALRQCFEEWGFVRIQFQTDIRNERSQAAISALGAVCEGTLRKNVRRSDGSLRDTIIYSITSQDWPKLIHRFQRKATS